ncbi:MAG TPA: hypothetical protein VFA26_25625, partial [Gemmataceae bacterium]|nr:hypothetical protein [Gemmataceae bacterium]
MTRVVTGSRLHFGLFTLAPPGRWPDLPGAPAHPARRFGGVGLMVEAPGVRLAVEPAAAWSAEGPLAERALAFARRFAGSLPPGSVPPHHVHVERAAPEHAGLGTGTQLGLATARALAVSSGLPGMAAEELADRVGRGARSALGVHGFAQGGFLVEAGQGPAGGISPLVARAVFPEEWRVVVALPAGEPGLHGGAE